MEEIANPTKTIIELQIKATIERMHPSASKQLFIPHSDPRKLVSITSGQAECDDRADGASNSVVGSSSTNDDFSETTPGEGKSHCYFKA